MQRLSALIRQALGLVLIAMVVLNVANAAGRYLFGKAVPGSDELLTFAMVWLVFVGAVLVAASNDHLGFDLLRRVLPGRARRVLHRVQCLVIMLLSGFVAFQSWSVLEKLAQVDQRSMATGIPMAIPHAAVLAGMALISLVSLGLMLRPPPSPGARNDAGGDPPQNREGMS